MKKTLFKGLHLHKICLPGYQVTSPSPVIVASQPVLRSETLVLPFTHENLTNLISTGINSSKPALACKGKRKGISEGILDTLILQLDLSKYRLSKILNCFIFARIAIPRVWLGI